MVRLRTPSAGAPSSSAQPGMALLPRAPQARQLIAGLVPAAALSGTAVGGLQPPMSYWPCAQPAPSLVSWLSDDLIDAG